MNPSDNEENKNFQQNALQEIKRIRDDIKKEFDKNITPFIISGFAFIFALVWRDFIRDIVDAMIEASGVEYGGYLYSFLSALLVSAIAIIVVLALSRSKAKKDQENS